MEHERDGVNWVVVKYLANHYSKKVTLVGSYLIFGARERT